MLLCAFFIVGVNAYVWIVTGVALVLSAAMHWIFVGRFNGAHKEHVDEDAAPAKDEKQVMLMGEVEK